MWTKKDTERVERLFRCSEEEYWDAHPNEFLRERWDGYLWNKANDVIKQRAWKEFREWLMCECEETYVKEEMLDHLHFASNTIYEWVTSLCEEQCPTLKAHDTPLNYASGAYLHGCDIEKRSLRSHSQAEKNSEGF